MKQREVRELISIGVVALSVVAGFAAIVNTRVDEALRRRQESYAALLEESRLAPVRNEATPMQTKVDRTKSWIDSNNTNNSESSLYASLMSLGESLHLRIDRMEPAGSSVDGDGFAHSTNFLLDAVGSYESIALFIADVEREYGFSGVKHFHLELVNTDQADQVHVVLETTHSQFDPSKVNLSSQGDDAGDDETDEGGAQ